MLSDSTHDRAQLLTDGLERGLQVALRRHVSGLQLVAQLFAVFDQLVARSG
jgi:hypothetical protein